MKNQRKEICLEYLKARKKFREVADQDEVLRGNDNIIGRIGEAIAHSFLMHEGRSPEVIENQTEEGYDIICNKDKTQRISVKTITSENKSGGTTRINNKYDELICIYINDNLKVEKLGHIRRNDTDLRSLDWTIIASYAFYSLALFMLWRRGPDALSLAPVDVTHSLSNWLLRGIGFLIFILLLDAAVALDFMINGGRNASRLISFGTVPLILLLLATVISLPLMFSRTRTVPTTSPEADTEDMEIAARLESLIMERQLFLDPEITVQRLAKRLGLPSRRVSAAVNRTQGTNMSQYVNTFRLRHAARLLTETDKSVTEIAMKSGFLSRSNFYREFQKAYDQSPTEYRTDNKPKFGIGLQ